MTVTADDTLIGSDELEALFTTDTPPCEVLHAHPDREPQPCCRPSVAQVKLRCHRCDSDDIVFICAPCLDVLKRGLAIGCSECRMVGVFSWVLL
jgi:hypothetical protein